jgi:Holliday junction DNA helicase RuvA
MIGRIRGNLTHKQPPEILVEVGGVGYEIQVPMTTLFRLPELGAEVSLVTHFVVREDAQLLYGFIDEQDRTLFRQLIKVNGVGPKLALTILSGMDSASFVRCVQRDDISSLMALPGVGKKTAERLLVEMRDKLKDWLAGAGGATDSSQGGQVVAPLTDIVADAEGALIALGYKPQDASRMVTAINDDSIDDSEELIRRALKATVRGR